MRHDRGPSLRLGIAVLLTVAVLIVQVAMPSPSRAFCGFYVGGADQRLYANATIVVLMRDGNRTVLSMQNDYQGPPTAFALVVPVPVVLSEENVRTLPRDVFDRVDQLAAPRLVEYWEEDPCFVPAPLAMMADGCPTCGASPSAAPAGGAGGDLGVRVEAEFAVGEYDIVILSARDSSGLETWLHQERYNIPEGASEVLRPYVESGTKFFVARVDPRRVTFEHGRAVLSPLRFHYDTPEFSLPVRLGLLSSAGEQDLLVHILARNQRYDVANYANTFIPTNLRVRESVRDHFGAFYESVFRETVARNPRTVVTEYAWDATTCDPCPGPALSPSDLSLLGTDVLPSTEPAQLMVVSRGAPLEVSLADGRVLGTTPLRTTVPPGPVELQVREGDGRPRQVHVDAVAGGMVQVMFLTAGAEPRIVSRPSSPWSRVGSGLTLTRLHYRYTRDTLGDDLVFRAAPPVLGGRGVPDANGVMEQAVQPGSTNNFQGRYAMLHPWTGPIACAQPRRGRWGGPPGSDPFGRGAASGPPPRGAGSTFARAAAPTPPPVLASVVEGTLAWAPTTGIQGMTASALVATQDVTGATPASPPPVPEPPSPTAPIAPVVAPNRPANAAPAADVAPAGSCSARSPRAGSRGATAVVGLACVLASIRRRRRA